MNHPLFALVLALPLAGAAQAQMPPLNAAAPEARPARKPLGRDALRDSGTFPQDLAPAAPRPQVRLPLGRKPPVAAGAASAGGAGGGPAIDDQVARCKAQAATPAARAACS